MIRLHIRIDSDGNGVLVMPLNDGERVGFVETVIEYDESTIPQPFQDNIDAELLKPIGERGPGFPGNAWKAVVSPSDAARIERRNDVRLGRHKGMDPVEYFYDTNGDFPIDGKSVPALKARFGDVRAIVNGIDGPMTSSEALAEVINPPEGEI